MLRVVALHAESVDRNAEIAVKASQAAPVALHAESVDRNQKLKARAPEKPTSLSMRRAWIEIK